MSKKIDDGAIIALLLWYQDDTEGEDVRLWHTKVSKQNHGWLLVSIENNQPLIELLPEYIERLEEVNDDISEIVGVADYYLSLSLGDLPDNLAPSSFDKTGLTWIEG